MEGGEFFFKCVLGRVEGPRFIFECLPQPHSSIPLVGKIGEGERKPVPEPSADQSSKDSEQAADKCYFIGSKVQFDAYAIGGIVDLAYCFLCSCMGFLVKV